MSQKKTVAVLFFNNSVKRWPILIILACSVTKKLDVNDCNLCPPHLNIVATLPHEMQLSFWPFTTVNSY